MDKNLPQIYTHTEEAWKAMLEECGKASISIEIEQYIFDQSGIGEKFIEVLKRKAREGIKVRLLIDTAGSYSFYLSSVPADLRKSGIEVRFFNVISPWRIPSFFSWFFRNHRKTLIIDGQIAFTGGTGVGGYMKDWRDTTGRVEGQAVKEMRRSFQDMWNLADEKDLISKVKKFRRYSSGKLFVTNAPYFKKRFLYRAFLRNLSGAKKYIYLTTPYFIPNHQLVRILKRAAKRGVEVKIILPDKIDVKVVALASYGSFGELLKQGVKIFKYTPAVLHAKTAVVDGKWGTFGSFNLDSLSFVYNYEANIMTADSYLVKALESHFIEDLKSSNEVIYEEWRKRPFLNKIKEFLAHLLRGIL